MSDSPPDHRIQLPPEEMRALGHRVVDVMVDHFTALADLPVAGDAKRPQLEALLREPAPEAGIGWSAAMDRVARDVFPAISHVDHPRFFAYVPGPSNFVGAMADALVAGFNPFAGSWVGAAGPAQVELVTIDWLRAACGMPESAGGMFLSGGSMANLTALAAARHRRFGTGDFSRAVIYCSDQTHSAVDRGARTLGFRADQLRVLPSDDDFRIRLDVLEATIDEDAAAGRIPFCAVANAGTTSTGAVDPIAAMAVLCRRGGMWLHVDGAYGAPAALTERGRALLRGLGEADSLALDPHKWLFQPFECGCVLVREAPVLREAFRAVPAYLKDSDLAEEEVNFRDWGVQLTRSFRALKLWLSIQVFGLAAFRSAVEWGMALAEAAEDELRASPAWEVITPAQLAVVTFRYRAPGLDDRQMDELQLRITRELLASGYAMLSTTELRGRVALRLCTINPRTTEEEVRETVRRLESIGRSMQVS